MTQAPAASAPIKSFVGVHMESRPLVFRNENRVAFDSMVFVDLVLTEAARLELLKQWKNGLKCTKFFVSTKVIDETYGVLINKCGKDPVDARAAIVKVKETLDIQELKYDKSVDNKQGFALFKEYQRRFGYVNLDEHINDGRIIAHLQREGINVVYSREEKVRKLAQIAGMEARNFISF